tara:strand:- start:299 stop:970 length:672 start_codon:yes stop_codon:yes gene_type:complete
MISYNLTNISILKVPFKGSIKLPIMNENKEEIHTKVYDMLNQAVKVFQGTKIIEGFIIQRIIYEILRDSGKYDTVSEEYPIPLNPDDPKKRKTHKVDIFCIDEKNKLIDAFNSKGASFNNTKSQENDLAEYNKYKDAIKRKYPEYTVQYSILKDKYDPCEKKYKAKCDYLSQHGIKHYCTQTFLMEFGLSKQQFEIIRKERVYNKLKERIQEANLDIDFARHF